MMWLFSALTIIFAIRLAYSYFKLHKAAKGYDRVLKLGRRYGEWEEEVEFMFSNLYLLASKIRTNGILLGLFAAGSLVFALGSL